jgi:single-stranded DNA-binding protein
MNGIAAAFTGKLFQDAEQRYLQDGTPMLTFSVCVEDAKPDPSKREWVRCVVYGDQVLELAERLLAPVEVYVEGRLRLNEWTGQDGANRAGLRLTAWAVQPQGQIGRRRPTSQRKTAVADNANYRAGERPE